MSSAFGLVVFGRPSRENAIEPAVSDHVLSADLVLKDRAMFDLKLEL